MPVEKDAELRQILQQAETIAVVGASSSEEKAAHRVPAYLKEQGYRIVPVNPGSEEILGEPVVASLAEVGAPVDVVEVFRPAEEAPGIARAAVAAGARVLWLQEGIASEEAARIAEEGGLRVVMDACMMASHRRLFAL